MYAWVYVCYIYMYVCIYIYICIYTYMCLYQVVKITQGLFFLPYKHRFVLQKQKDLQQRGLRDFSQDRQLFCLEG